MKPPWLTWFAGVLGLVVSCCSCADKGSGEARVLERVAYVKHLALPSDAAQVKESRPALNGYSATAHWDFETSEERNVYLSWVDQQLEHDDFKLKSSDESSLVVTRSSRGEVESVNIRAIPSNGKLRVQIAYAIDSD